MYTVRSFQNLIELLKKLPGVGPKSAERMAYFILRLPKEEAMAFSSAIMDVKKYVTRCKVCFNLCEGEKCLYARTAGVTIL